MPRRETWRVSLTPPTLAIAGTLASPEEVSEIERFMLAVHEAALADCLPELRLDLRALSFVSSRTLRVFAHWVELVERGRPYRIRVLVNRQTFWQSATFSALQEQRTDVIAVEPID